MTAYRARGAPALQRARNKYKKSSKYKTTWATYYEANRASILVRLRRNRLLAVYGITVEQYDAMVRKQRGVCAICKKKGKRKTGSVLYIDHCHRTGRTRGLLCAGCNTALGVLERESRWTKSALKYLARFT